MQETQETLVRYLGQEDPLEYKLATHSNILAWEIPWMEEPSGQQSMELQRVRHKRATKQIYKWLIHVDVWQKPTQHSKAIILQLKINLFKK